METINIVKDFLLLIASIIGAIGVIAGAFFLVMKVFKMPSEVVDLKRRVTTLENEKEFTKIYYTGLREDVLEVKQKIDRVETILLGREGMICK